MGFLENFIIKIAIYFFIIAIFICVIGVTILSIVLYTKHKIFVIGETKISSKKEKYDALTQL